MDEKRQPGKEPHPDDIDELIFIGETAKVSEK